ncbi:MAG: Gfo/Idh/MocA family oxidoreductase [Geminicoccaceae bacterium]
MQKLRFGVMGVAKIAREKVIPPLQKASRCEVVAIASRDAEHAAAAAKKLGIPRAHGSYEALLADPEVDAVYIPLPNHLHVEWSRRAAEAGKLVLCEKPLGLTAEDAASLIAVRDRTGKVIQEAFMVRTHPQWLKAREIVRSGRLGTLRAIQGWFSYHLTDPANVRNVREWGGGGLLDIGCYPITTSRFVTDREPTRVAALIDRDPTSGIDRQGSVILDFGDVQSSFGYGTQMVPRQTMQFFGDKGRLEVEVPFNAPVDRPCRLALYQGPGLGDVPAEVIEIPTCDQYGIMGDAFAAAVQDGTPPPVSLENSVANMKVIDACFRAAETGAWVAL